MQDGKHVIDRDRCSGCGRCVTECFSSTLVLKGRVIGAEELMRTILEDRVYYEESRGGVTFSGGEPVLQNDFLAYILESCKKEDIHTALQTAGNYNFGQLEMLLPYLDFIMYDLKGFFTETYKVFVGADRKRVFENLRSLAECFQGEVAVRTPCVGGVNDTDEEIEGIARTAGELKNIKYFQLIPYHGLAKLKYDALNVEFASQCNTPPPGRVRELEDLAARYVTVFNQERGIIPRKQKN
jgi:pyruvate formate lyase activating enzyme